MTKSEIVDLTKKFWQLVWQHKHWVWRQAILNEVKYLQVKAQGKVTVEVVSARALDTKQQKHLCEQLSQKLHCEIDLINIIKPHLLAGVVLSIGDQRVDSSFKGRLDNLYRALAGN